MKLHSDRYAQHGPSVRSLQQVRQTCSHTKVQKPFSPSQNEPASMPRRKVSKCKTLFMIFSRLPKDSHRTPKASAKTHTLPRGTPKVPQTLPNSQRSPRPVFAVAEGVGGRGACAIRYIYDCMHCCVLCFCATPLRSGLVQRVTCPSLTCATVSRSVKRRRSAPSPTHPGDHLATPSWLGPLIVVLLVFWKIT